MIIKHQGANQVSHNRLSEEAWYEISKMINKYKEHSQVKFCLYSKFAKYAAPHQVNKKT